MAAGWITESLMVAAIGGFFGLVALWMTSTLLEDTDG